MSTFPVLPPDLMSMFDFPFTVMIAETISLGILSLPSVLATIGMAPGAILIASLGIVATYSGYVIGQFKMAHPWVSNLTRG